MPDSADILVEILDEFKHLRSLTLDLLDIAERYFLEFSPHYSMGPMWKQFRHVGRVQENYTAAIQSGSAEFGFDGCNYRGQISRPDLVEYLRKTNHAMLAAIEAADADTTIDWFGERCSLAIHLARLATHESLHHGQFILYARSAGVSLPKSWVAWGE